MDLARILNSDEGGPLKRFTRTSRSILTDEETLRARNLMELMAPRTAGLASNKPRIIRVEGDYDAFEQVPPTHIRVFERPDRSVEVKEAGEGYKLEREKDILVIVYGPEGTSKRQVGATESHTTVIRSILTPEEEQRVKAIGEALGPQLHGMVFSSAEMIRFEGDPGLMHTVPSGRRIVLEMPDGTLMIKEPNEIFEPEKGVYMLSICYRLESLVAASKVSTKG